MCSNSCSHTSLNSYYLLSHIRLEIFIDESRSLLTNQIKITQQDSLRTCVLIFSVHLSILTNNYCIILSIYHFLPVDRHSCIESSLMQNYTIISEASLLMLTTSQLPQCLHNVECQIQALKCTSVQVFIFNLNCFSPVLSDACRLVTRTVSLPSI